MGQLLTSELNVQAIVDKLNVNPGLTQENRPSWALYKPRFFNPNHQTVYLLASELNEETIGNELDVSAHESTVHSNQRHRQSVSEKLLLDSDSVADDLVDALLRRTIHDVREQQAGKVGVEALHTHSHNSTVTTQDAPKKQWIPRNQQRQYEFEQNFCTLRNA